MGECGCLQLGVRIQKNTSIVYTALGYCPQMYKKKNKKEQDTEIHVHIINSPGVKRLFNNNFLTESSLTTSLISD